MRDKRRANYKWAWRRTIAIKEQSVIAIDQKTQSWPTSERGVAEERTFLFVGGGVKKKGFVSMYKESKYRFISLRFFLFVNKIYSTKFTFSY